MKDETAKTLIETLTRIAVAVEAVATAIREHGAAPVSAAVEEDRYDVWLRTPDLGNMIGAIKVVRSLNGCTLYDAKRLVDASPSLIKAMVTKAEADDIRGAFANVGAAVDIRERVAP